MPYRDDVEHLKQRLEAVRGELSEVRLKTQAIDELKRHQQALEDEASELQRELAARDRRRSLPLLDGVRVASPCDADWDEMVGDERKRFCSHCEKNVYNLSAMKRAEAEALLQAHEGRLCIRLYRRADGTVLTADCPVGVRRRRRRWVAVTALAFGALGGVGWLFFARATAGIETMGVYVVDTGKSAMPEEIAAPVEPQNEPAPGAQPAPKAPGDGAQPPAAPSGPAGRHDRRKPEVGKR